MAKQQVKAQLRLIPVMEFHSQCIQYLNPQAIAVVKPTTAAEYVNKAGHAVLRKETFESHLSAVESEGKWIFCGNRYAKRTYNTEIVPPREKLVTEVLLRNGESMLLDEDCRAVLKALGCNPRATE